jgi:hypothetical protein
VSRQPLGNTPREMQNSTKRTYVIHELPERVAVVRMEARSEVPSWAWTGSLAAVVRTTDELSIVCDQKVVPGDVRAERDWVALKLEGPIPFTQTGVLASLLDPLASASISVFAISTFDTDYVLVKADVSLRAREILRAEGHRVE